MGRRILAILQLFVIAIYCVIDSTVYIFGISNNEIPNIIEQYCNLINEGEYLKLSELVDCEDAEEYLRIFSNEENIKNNIGIMNVKSIKIEDICSVSDFDEYEKYYVKDEYDNPKYYIVQTNMQVEEEREGDFITGNNYLAIVIAVENGVEKIFDLYHLDANEGKKYFSNMNSRAANYDYSVTCSSNYWTTPSNIMVRISNGTVKTVSFYDYCLNVSANEFGYASWNIEAKKACAMAVKNFSWRLKLTPRKHAAYGYHATTSDQKYDESVDSAKVAAVESAVDAIWDYVMLDSEYKLFSSFYAAELVPSANNHQAYTKYHGGALSQRGAQALALDGMLWKEILHYYYDTSSSIAKYGDILPDGEIKIVDLNHTPIYSGTISYDTSYHWKTCTVCNCCHIKTSHSLRQSGGGYSLCTGCRYTCIK